MADPIKLVQCRRGHRGLTVCTSCFGAGVVSGDRQGSHAYVNEDGTPPTPGAQGNVVCQSCFGSGLLEPHSCFGSTPG